MEDFHFIQITDIKDEKKTVEKNADLVNPVRVVWQSHEPEDTVEPELIECVPTIKQEFLNDGDFSEIFTVFLPDECVGSVKQEELTNADHTENVPKIDNAFQVLQSTWVKGRAPSISPTKVPPCATVTSNRARAGKKNKIFIRNQHNSHEHQRGNDDNQTDSQNNTSVVTVTYGLPIQPALPSQPDLPQQPLSKDSVQAVGQNQTKPIQDPNAFFYTIEMRTILLNTYLDNSRDLSKTMKIIKEQYPEMRHRNIRRRTFESLYKKFMEKESLANQHFARKKQPPVVEVTCSFCEKKFKTENKLRRHQWIHTGEKPYACDCCDMRFSSSSSLARHRLQKHDIKTKPRIFKSPKPSIDDSEKKNSLSCDICGKTFYTKRKIEEHKRTHTSDRPYLCTICGKALRNDSCIRRHMMCVHKIKFNCDLCGKDYGTAMGLHIHKRDVHGVQA